MTWLMSMVFMNFMNMVFMNMVFMTACGQSHQVDGIDG